MEGSLARRSPADVLSELQRRKASGILTYRLDRVSRQIHIDAGVHIRFAASNHAAESLTAWFLERGGVAVEALRRAALEKPPEEFLGSTLARLGLIAPTDLVELTEMHIRRVARAAMRMCGGDYQFQEGALRLHDQIAGGLMTAELLLEWTRDVSDPEWIRQRLGSPDSRVLRDPRPPEGYQRVRLDPVEGYIMSRVDGIATIREICMVSPMGDDKTLCALLGLALAGILEMPAGAAELPAPAAPIEPNAPVPGGTARSSAPSSARDGRQGAGPPVAAAPYAVSAPPDARSPVPRPPQVAKPAAPAVTTPAPPQPAGHSPQPQTQPDSRPSNTGRPGPIALVPKPRGAWSGGGRSAKPARRPVAVAAKPPRAAERSAAETAAEIEAEMLRRFRDIHILDLYQVLDITPVATTEMIRRSYYALARRLHPDTFRRDDLKPKAEKVFGRITEAYSTLSQAALREKYDEEKQSRSGHHQDDKTTDAASVARMNFRHGRDHFEHGRLSEALSFLQNACQQDPTRAEHFEYLGLAQARNPRLRKQAEENLLKAIEMAPTSASAHAHLGQVYERTGAMDKARAMYKKALEWDPANEIALKGLETEGSTRKGILGLFSRK